ncbi:MAG: sulfotransferase [Bacteroidota bacterium]|nr:sulfotransferase [Bacteroidota bacterium]
MKIDKLSDIPFFFILGRPRSGTTLLASLFDAHPNVMLPFECPLIINLYRKYYKKKHWDKKSLLEFYADVVDQRKFESWRVDSEKLKNDLLACEGEAGFEDLIKVVYLNFNSFFPKKDILLFGDKNPVYSIYPKQLLKIFPDAKFIHLSRDYRDNILSIKKVDFEAPITALLAYRWRFATKRMLCAEQKYPKKFYKIKYEDLVSNPSEELKKICYFLGIPYKKDVLEFHKKKDELFENFDREHIERYHSSLLRPITNDKIYAWKKNMKPADIKIADKVVGVCGEKAGYERKNKKPTLPGLLSLVWINYGWLAYLLRFLVDILPFKLKMISRNKGPLLAVMFNKYILKK